MKIKSTIIITLIAIPSFSFAQVAEDNSMIKQAIVYVDSLLESASIGFNIPQKYVVPIKDSIIIRYKDSYESCFFSQSQQEIIDTTSIESYYKQLLFDEYESTHLPYKYYERSSSLTVGYCNYRNKEYEENYVLCVLHFVYFDKESHNCYKCQGFLKLFYDKKIYRYSFIQLYD